MDRTPKPMTGVKTHVSSAWMTDDSKGSATSGVSDNVLDRMSCFSFDAGTIPGSGAQSPALSTEASFRPTQKSVNARVDKSESRLGVVDAGCADL